MASNAERAERLAADRRRRHDERRITGCCHCGNPILAAGGRFWTHGAPGTIETWQGVRCPRGLTGALPNPEPDQARREVALKRRLLELAAPLSCPADCCEHGNEYHVDRIAESETIGAWLADVYSDRPGYAEAIG